MQINEFIIQLQHELLHLPQDNLNNQDIFIFYESQMTLEKFRVFFKKYETSCEEVSEKFLNKIKNRLATRWYNIARTRAAYNYHSFNKSETSANIFCKKVANLYNVAANSVIKYEKRSEKEVLMPSQFNHFLAPRYASQVLIASVIADLNNYPDVNNTLIQSIHLDMQLITNRLLAIIDKIPKDIEENDLFVKLESKYTIKKLKQLLESERDINTPITRQRLQPFIKFLKDRWAAIDGTDASYLIKPNSKVNATCLILASYLSLIGYRINYLNRNPERLVMPSPSQGLDQKIAYSHLQQFVYDHVKDSEALLLEMDKLDRSDWKNYLEGMDVEKLKCLLTNGKTFDLFLQAKDAHVANENQCRALLYCLFEVYKKDRAKKPKHTSMTGALFQYVTKVYNIEDKLNAANAVQDFIINTGDIAEFNQLLAQPSSKLFKHKGPLADSELQKFTAYVFASVDHFPQRIVKEMDSIELRPHGRF